MFEITLLTKTYLAVIAGVLAIVGNVSYLRDIFSKKVQPHAYTWLVWTIVTTITFLGQVAKGAGVGAIPTAVSGMFTLSIFLFSLRYGFKHVTKTDTAYLIVALCGIIPWILTDDPTLSVMIMVGIDLVAFIPTLSKTWEHPATETPLLFGTNVARHIMTLLSLQTYNVATTLHSISMVLTNTLMTLFILHKRRKAR